MERHWRDPVSDKATANAANTSIRQLARLFRNASGVTISRALLALVSRLSKARNLLRQTICRLFRLCAECGFLNASHFCRLYLATFVFCRRTSARLVRRDSVRPKRRWPSRQQFRSWTDSSEKSDCTMQMNDDILQDRSPPAGTHLRAAIGVRVREIRRARTVSCRVPRNGRAGNLSGVWGGPHPPPPLSKIERVRLCVSIYPGRTSSALRFHRLTLVVCNLLEDRRTAHSRERQIKCVVIKRRGTKVVSVYQLLGHRCAGESSLSVL